MAMNQQRGIASAEKLDEHQWRNRTRNRVRNADEIEGDDARARAEWFLSNRTGIERARLGGLFLKTSSWQHKLHAMSGTILGTSCAT